MSLWIGGIVSLGGVPGSGTGGSGSSGSGIVVINPGNNLGPSVLFQGANGITVTSPSTNVILIDGAGASGTQNSATKFSAQFLGITSGVFNHGLNTLNVIVQVYSSGTLRKQIIPDEIIVDTPNIVSLIFNRPASGYVVII